MIKNVPVIITKYLKVITLLGSFTRQCVLYVSFLLYYTSAFKRYTNEKKYECMSESYPLIHSMNSTIEIT